MLLSTAEAAKLLGLSPATLTRWRRLGNGPLPYFRVGVGAVKYHLADIEAHIAARRVPASHGDFASGQV